jgi:hypothetical protein
MRETDRILLEDAMRRRPVELNRTARTFLLATFVVLLLGLLGVLVQDMARPGGSATARAPATEQIQDIARGLSPAFYE